MTKNISLDPAALRTIFAECRQCGTCCKSYRKITLQPGEVEFIRKMGGHVGVDVSLAQLRDRSMDELVTEAEATGKVFMIHPDDKGCVFLQKRNDKYFCRIYHHRPRACQGFRCTVADSSFLDLFGGADCIHLLGQNRVGMPL
jgi:Fe-S-cluster containining protein